MQSMSIFSEHYNYDKLEAIPGRSSSLRQKKEEKTGKITAKRRCKSCKRLVPRILPKCPYCGGTRFESK